MVGENLRDRGSELDWELLLTDESAFDDYSEYEKITSEEDDKTDHMWSFGSF